MTGRYQSPLYRSLVERAKRNERQEDDPQSAKRNLTMTGPHPDPLALDQNLEPSAVATLGTATSTVIDASAAISLKRIADALERMAEAATELNEYGEGPAKAIGANIARALR